MILEFAHRACIHRGSGKKVQTISPLWFSVSMAKRTIPRSGLEADCGRGGYEASGEEGDAARGGACVPRARHGDEEYRRTLWRLVPDTDVTPKEIQVRKGGLFSLIPFGVVTGVNLQGCRYPLNNETLSSGTRGVSNKAVGSVITASAQSGDLLLLIER